MEWRAGVFSVLLHLASRFSIVYSTIVREREGAKYYSEENPASITSGGGGEVVMGSSKDTRKEQRKYISSRKNVLKIELI